MNIRDVLIPIGTTTIGAGIGYLLTRKIEYTAIGGGCGLGVGIGIDLLLGEAAPETYADRCGRLPTSSDSHTYITDWWKCALRFAEERGICSSYWYTWFRSACDDIEVVEGEKPFYEQSTDSSVGDYVDIWMGVPPVYLGRFKWVCEQK